MRCGDEAQNPDAEVPGSRAVAAALSGAHVTPSQWVQWCSAVLATPDSASTRDSSSMSRPNKPGKLHNRKPIYVTPAYPDPPSPTVTKTDTPSPPKVRQNCCNGVPGPTGRAPAAAWSEVATCVYRFDHSWKIRGPLISVCGSAVKR